jgi:GAF domain-containing protein
MVAETIDASACSWAPGAESGAASDMPERARADKFAEIARELACQPDLATALQAVVEYAVRTIESAEHAAITVKRGQQAYRTVASTGKLPLAVDDLQYAAGTGPCLEALESHHVVRVDDLATDNRWPAFAQRAAASTAVASMMSHRLFLESDDTIGALNLYSSRVAAFAETDPSMLDILATHCAIALAKAAEHDQNEHLRTALDTNRDIGIAIGVLMTSMLITKVQAFDLLRIASQHGHRKLRDVALEVIDTGVLPGADLLAHRANRRPALARHRP